ncbi:MAG TPA: hypothetical protein VMK32_00340 [Burkholderiaceae bacterium]|nr:hypothetical protein [Burkholderiaceae bacterium]
MQRLNEKEVGQIAHNSSVGAEISCDRFRLRVKSEPFIGSPIDVDADDSGRQRSNTELTSDSHSRPVTAEDHAPKHDETPESWGLIPAEKRGLSEKPFQPSQSPNAGIYPAFFLRVPQCRQPGARRAEFISVSGQCAARSALSSDLRIKRISGGVAATEHLRAPMNSPTGDICRAAGFLL